MAQDEQAKFAAWARARRAELRLNRVQLAELAGISRPTLRRVESGDPTHQATRRAVERALTKHAAKRSLET